MYLHKGNHKANKMYEMFVFLKKKAEGTYKKKEQILW